MLLWSLKDGNQYGYDTLNTDQTTAVAVAQLIQPGTPQNPNSLWGGEVYNYVYRSQAYDKIKNP